MRVYKHMQLASHGDVPSMLGPTEPATAANTFWQSACTCCAYMYIRYASHTIIVCLYQYNNKTMSMVHAKLPGCTALLSQHCCTYALACSQCTGCVLHKTNEQHVDWGALRHVAYGCYVVPAVVV